VIKVFSAQDYIEVAFWGNYLEEQGIACQIRNDFSPKELSERGGDEPWPELWLLKVSDELDARKYLASDPLGIKEQAPWNCSYCGEESDGQFAQCWNCEQDRNI